MRLLEAIEKVRYDDKERLEDILWVLEDRRDTVEMQEPFGDSEYFYEKWEEKFDGICELFDDLETYIEGEEWDEKWLNNFRLAVDIYQSEYGGLKRLKI